MRQDFYEHINEKKRELFYESMLFKWNQYRNEVHETISSLSYINSGLIPNKLNQAQQSREYIVELEKSLRTTKKKASFNVDEIVTHPVSTSINQDFKSSENLDHQKKLLPYYF
jgi:hypothetical protein